MRIRKADITIDPMPGARQLGARYFVTIARKGGDLTAFFGGDTLAQSEAHARLIAHEYDEVIVTEGSLAFRIWDRDGVR